MERVFCDEDLVALALLAAGFLHAVQPRELDHALVGLGAAVAEKDAARPGVADESPRELALAGVAEKIADVNELAGLPLHRGDPVRMAVAERADGDARREIEVTVARVVPHL